MSDNQEAISQTSSETIPVPPQPVELKPGETVEVAKVMEGVKKNLRRLDILGKPETPDAVQRLITNELASVLEGADVMENEEIKKLIQSDSAIQEQVKQVRDNLTGIVPETVKNFLDLFPKA